MRRKKYTKADKLRYYKSRKNNKNLTSQQRGFATLRVNQLTDNIEKSFKLPNRTGGRRWNIYRVPNFILNGKSDNNVHGGLVLDENNNKVLLVEVTHSKRKGKRTNIAIRNLRSNDIDEKGNLRESYIVRRLVVSINTKDGEQGIDSSALNKQLNDLQFTEEERQFIINELSNLSTAETKYKKFIDLSNKKD